MNPIPIAYMNSKPTVTVFADIFSINTCTTSTAPVIIRSPDIDTICPGESLTITTTPGSGGTGTCTDEYRYSTDNEVTWSAWSASVPVFTAIAGTNMVQSRRACDGSCSSDTSIVYWTVEDTIAPTVVCKNVAVSLDANGNASIATTDVFQSATDNCGTINQVSVSPNDFDCSNLGNNSVTLTYNVVNDGHGNMGTCTAIVTVTGSGTSTILGITVSGDIQSSTVGSGTFSITAVYGQAMNTASTPVFSFPNTSEDPLGAGMLVQAIGSWTDAFTFTQYYDVIDLDQVLSRVDVQVCGGVDLTGNMAAARLETDLFCANTTDIPVPGIVDIIFDHAIHTAFVRWDRATDYGGLNGLTWTQTDSLLYFQFPGIGDITPYFDLQYTWLSRTLLKINFLPKQQLPDFRHVAVYFKWPIARRDDTNICQMYHTWNGQGFDVDYKAPYITSLTTNLTTITNANTGTGTFQITAQYNEDFDGNVVFSFPTLNEDPTSVLTLVSTVKTGSQVVATYSVGNVGAFIPDIDIQVSGAVNNPVINSLQEVQADTVFPNVFSINTCTQSTPATIVRLPDSNVVCPGEILTITANTGNGGTELCADEYRYSTDNETTWSAWSTNIPIFAAVTGTNVIMSRRSCGSGCLSVTNRVEWVVSDTTPPLIACPANQFIAADSVCSNVIGNWNALSTSDDCGMVTVSQSPDSSTVLTSIGNTETIILTADDSNGNIQTCSFTVTLQDFTSPTVVCQDITVYLDASGSASITTNDVFQSGTDNCGTISQVSVSPNTFDCSNLGDITVMLTVNDGHENTATCTANVTVNDTIAPIVVCQDVAIYLDANGSASINTNDIFQSGTDNCGIINQTFVSPSTFDCSNLGDNTVTLTIDDGNGNTANCTATVTVNDNTIPTVICQNITVNLDANGSASISTADVLQSASDNCSTINQVSVLPNTFDCSNLGDNTVTLTINDGNGNTADCTATVTINDNTAPTVACQDIAINLDVNGSASISTADVFQSGSDNCSTINQVSILPNTFDCSNLGDNTVTLTINDGNGNTADCNATVTINDNTAPTVVCQNITTNLDANGSVVISTADVFQSASDNCSTINQVSVSPNTFDCSNLGDNTVTLTIDDGNGNTADCTATVMINDNISPTVVCQNINVNLDANGSVVISTADVFQSASDNCSTINQVAVSPNTFDCSNLGDNTVTLTINDGNENTANCTATVTVNDSIAPIVVCQDITINLDANGSVSISTADVFQSGSDNCSTINQVSVLPNTFDCSNLGDNTVTLTINDGNGNTADCTATVTINDNTAPTVTCQNITVNLDTNGSASISTPDVFQSGSDNCSTINQVSVLPNAFDCSNLGDNTVTLTIDDGNGNTADCTATVMINDNISPTVVCQNINVNLDANGSVVISTADVFQSASDNCSTINQVAVSPNTFDCSNLGDNTVTLTINDGNENTADCTATVTVNDSIAPTVVCQDITINLDANGSASISTADVFQSGSDNCSTINQVSVLPNTFDCSNLGDNTVTLTIDDGHENIADCTATITINDNTAPTVICQNITTNLDANGSASISTPDVFQSGSDNCSTINQVSVLPNAFDCSNLGDNTVTLTIDDGNGNTADCTATVTINDNTAPTVICQDISVNLDANGSASISTADVFQSASDNCSTINQVSVSPNTFDCSNLGDNTVTLTIDDGNGNTADCMATVTINDNINACVVLPVKLTAFKALAEKDAVLLVWKTASEHNNAGFEVERSENGIGEFKKIALVEGAGTTNESHNYQLKDKQVHAGQPYFYRLKQMDYDGTFQYSDIVQAMLSDGKLTLAVFPNPVSSNGIIHLQMYLPQASEVVLTLFDAQGRIIRTEQHDLEADLQTLQMSINDLPADAYFLKIAANGESVYQQLVITR